MESFKVVCINDKGRPTNYVGEWIQKDSVYTVVEVKFLINQRMAAGFRLAEVNMGEESPYQFFCSNRFRPYDQTDSEAWTEEVLEELFPEETYVDAL